MSPGISTRLLATQSDERLLALVRQGHERAFEALVHRYRRPLLGYCRRLLPEAPVEDVVQLALLKAWIAVREGAEVRDLKAWLYRVVHNTAVNAAREGARTREPHVDLTSLPATERDMDLGLRMREALSEVAALPPLQREVLMRTAVAGHSHERVAGDLGISDGAVRGLLYRARLTLRRAATALIPPPLLTWAAGRANQSSPTSPAPERLVELAGGGGTVGLGGLLLKGGVVAVTAGTVLGGAALVHLSASAHRHARHRLVAVAVSPGAAQDGLRAQTGPGIAPEPSVDTPRSRRAVGRGGRPRAARSSGRSGRVLSEGGQLGPGSSSGGSAPRSMVRSPGGAPLAPSRSGATVTVSVPSPGGGAGSGAGQSGGSGQGGGVEGAGQAGASGATQSEPVGSAASSGSSGAGAPPAGQSSETGGGSSGGASPSGGSGSGSSGSSGSSSSGSGSSGSSGSSGGEGAKESASGDEHSLVGTVVHEVGSLLEHVLH